MRMPRPSAGLAPAFLLLAALALTASCRTASEPMHFYSLTPMDIPLAAPSVRAVGLSVGVGPLDIPRSVDRPDIVTRTGPNSVQLSEFHRWGGVLQGDMLQVLTQNVGLLLESDRVVAFPWANFLIPEYRIPITVQRFDGELGGQVVLEATWAIARTNTSQSLVVRRTTITEPVDGPDYEALVAASSRAMAGLSREIADELLRRQGG